MNISLTSILAKLFKLDLITLTVYGSIRLEVALISIKPKVNFWLTAEIEI